MSHLTLLSVTRSLKTGFSIVSYGDRSNRYEDVSEYFRAHFLQVHKRKDIGNRHLFVVCFYRVCDLRRAETPESISLPCLYVLATGTRFSFSLFVVGHCRYTEDYCCW